MTQKNLESLDCMLNSYAVELQALEDYRNFSATTIQRYYRGWIVRLRQAREWAAFLEQQHSAKSAAQQAKLSCKAARTIQDAWRSFSNRRIYRFYRDLIHFREASDPRQLLRCINAREAALIDPAAGLHVRFRLGGSNFPPLVLYKIFTHRPVTDIGAFGPRNYAAEDAAVHSPAALHNKPDSGSSSTSSAASQKAHKQAYQECELPARYREYIKPDGTMGLRSTKGWYRRVDNNGWRPVTERLLLDQKQQAALPPPTAAADSSIGSIRRTRRRRRCTRRQRQRQNDAAGNLQCGDGTCIGHHSLETGSESGSSSSSSSRSISPVYHYSSIVRREDRARRLKQRRRQWLLKMYRAGMQASAAAGAGAVASIIASADSHATRCVSAAATVAEADRTATSADHKAANRSGGGDSDEQILQLLERQLLQGVGDHIDGSDVSTGAAVTDWDVDELVGLGLDAGILAWSQKLNYDSYQQHWISTAVTLGSEAAVPVSEAILVQQLQLQ